MEFTKELVEKNYYLLGSNTTSQEDRQKANKYLLAFQVLYTLFSNVHKPLISAFNS